MRSMKKTEGNLAHSDVPSPHLVLGPEKVSVNFLQECPASQGRLDPGLTVLGKLAILPLSS